MARTKEKKPHPLQKWDPDEWLHEKPEDTIEAYVYRVKDVLSVIDGDTYYLRLDMGFHIAATVSVRLLGYDTPELRSGTTYEKERGKEARALAQKWLDEEVLAGRVYVKTEKDDSFGRWLGIVFSGDGRLLGDALRAEGLASVWPERWREEFA